MKQWRVVSDEGSVRIFADPLLSLTTDHHPPTIEVQNEVTKQKGHREGGLEMKRQLYKMVPKRGLEPPRFYPLVPETSASTNSATSAQGAQINQTRGVCQ